MKKILRMMKVVLVLTSIISCQRLQKEDFLSCQEVQCETKSSSLVPEDYFVTEEDMNAYIHFQKVLIGDDYRDVEGYTAYVEDGNLLFYVIQYSQGWRIISPDKRGPIVLCDSGEGRFDSMIENCPDILIWLEGYINDIEVRHRFDVLGIRPLDEKTLEREEQCLRFWRMMRPGIEDIPVEETKSPSFPVGHWELVSASYHTELYKQVDHYCTTHWTQGLPYNKYCPLNSSGTAHRPAGCVAISGAQMLKYLHDFWGTPATAPTGLDANYYGQNYTSSAWTFIQYNSQNYLGYLVRDVGTRVNMVYADSSSTAITEDLIDNVFNFYGIDADYSAYTNLSHLSVMHSLDDSIPVIMRAGGIQHHFLWFTWETDGHSFIIDGYKEFRTEVTGEYEWVWDEVYNSPVPYIENTVFVTYEEPQMEYVKMNWGWGNTFDDVWYTPTGTWEVQGLSSSGDTVNLHFDYSREFIHNFSVL